MNNYQFFPAVLILVFLALSCSPVKQVLKSPEKTKQVAAEYLKTFNVKDSIVYIAGKDTTILKDTTVRDTVYAYTRAGAKETVIREVRYLDRLVVDTVSIYERAKLAAMQDILKFKDSIATVQVVANAELKKEKNNLLIWLIASWVFIVVAIAFLILRKIRFHS